MVHVRISPALHWVVSRGPQASEQVGAQTVLSRHALVPHLLHVDHVRHPSLPTSHRRE
jgi:hypothetical protein